MSMKITGPGQIQSKSIKKSSKQRSAGASDFSSKLDRSGSTDAPQNVGGASPLTPLDALLSLQEVPDATDGRSKGLARANEMLDLLEEVRKGILLGAVSETNLRNLANMARNQRENKNSPNQHDERLREILDDIELRAEVELAKLGL